MGEQDQRIKVGDTVKVKDEALACYTVAANQKFAQRIGTVEKLFIPLGSLTQRARVLWHKRGNRGKEFHETFNVRDLDEVTANFNSPTENVG